MSIDSSASKTTLASFNAVIEIAAESGPVKYELDKDSGRLMVDRFMVTAMHYPCNYGFVPDTLADDGDPVDVLVMAPFPVQPGCLVQVRPVGILMMTDEAGFDAKILSVPIEKVCVEYANIQDISDVSQAFLDRVSHFFAQYKALDDGKWVKVVGWEGKAKAISVLKEGLSSHV